MKEKRLEKIIIDAMYFLNLKKFPDTNAAHEIYF